MKKISYGLWGKSMKFLPVFFLIFAFSIYGQTKRNIPKPTSTQIPKTTSTENTKSNEDTTIAQKAIVEKLNGDRISGMFISGDKTSVSIEISNVLVKIDLKEIRTIRFADEPETQSKVDNNKSQETIIELESALVFKNGEAVPVARTSFALLDESAVELMRQAGVRSQDGKTDDQSIYFGFLIGAVRGSAEVSNSLTLIKQHFKYQFETDFNGRATIKNIAPGTYYIFGYSEIRRANVIWNVRVDVKEGDQLKIVLDQKNAGIAL